MIFFLVALTLTILHPTHAGANLSKMASPNREFSASHRTKGRPGLLLALHQGKKHGSLIAATGDPSLMYNAGQDPTLIPPTQAGKQLGAFLSAFNTGDRETLRAFFEKSMETPPDDTSATADITNHYFELYRQSRGLTLRKIIESAPAMIRAAVQAKSTEVWYELTVFITAQPPAYVEAAPPFKIAGIGFSTSAAPAELMPRRKLSEREVSAKVESLMKTLVAGDSFSGVVYVSKNENPLYAKAFGPASKTWHVPNRIDTGFNLASIAKMFTAVAVAQLVEQGKLSFSDTVGSILPDYPNKEVAQKVTLHQLLSHTSGMIGARALAQKHPQPQKARTIAEMLGQFASEPLTSPPGQQFDYSNAGYILLGAIIEKASGQSYYDYVRDHVFKPAGMNKTDFYELDAEPPNLATGYMDGPGGTRLSNIFDLDVKGSPAGMAYSTGADMARFFTALIQHKLLRQETLERLWAGVAEEPGRKTKYAYGARVETYNGTRIISHGGGWKGVTNQFDMYPESGYVVIILSNYDDDPMMIASKLREWLTQGTPK